MILGQDDLARQLVLDKYLILGELSEGSLGSIYLGRADGGSGEPVFVKSISPLHLKSDEAIELFEQEVGKLEGIRHANLAAVLDHGDESGSQLVISEYIPGFDLGHWFSFVTKKRGELPIGVAVHIVVKMLGGLEALHQAKDASGASLGIVHRDVMPSNIVIDRAGVVRVTDFGLSRIVSEGTAVVDPGVTDKLAYLTPELVSKNEPGPPSDVYGAALVLFEILTNTNPFAGDNLGMTISAVLMKPPPAAKSLREEIPDELSDIIAKALSKKPEDRHASAAELAAALEPFAADASELAAMVAEDYVNPEMLALKEVVSLEKRDRLLDSASNIKPTKPPRRKPITRLPTEQRERERASAAGEVTARSRSSRDSEVVWRKSPSTIIPPMKEERRRSEPRKKKSQTPLIIAMIIGFVAVAVILFLVLS